MSDIKAFAIALAEWPSTAAAKQELDLLLDEIEWSDDLRSEVDAAIMKLQVAFGLEMDRNARSKLCTACAEKFHQADVRAAAALVAPTEPSS